MAVALAGLALSAVQLGVGLYQSSQAEDPEQVQETQEMKAARARAAQMAKSGFTPQETAAFKQSLAAAGNTAYRRGVDMGGGNLAAALRAGINSQQLGARNQFAAQDAQLMRQNIAQSNSLEQGYQGLRNQQVAQHNQLAQQQNAAATQSINSGLSGLGSALNLNQALNYNPSGTTPTTQQPTTTGSGYNGVLTPSGQGAGNSWYNPTTIGANGNAVAAQQPSMFQPQQNLGGLYGMRYNPLTGQYEYQ